MAQLLQKAKELGLPAKVHVNQFSSMKGVAEAVAHDALSVDHLEVMEEADFTALEKGNTIPTVLPGCSFYLDIPFAPARELMQRNLPLAIGSDFNPGSAPSYNPELNLVLAVIRMRMKPEEAFNAMTINAAAAMQLEKEVGSIAPGKKAHFYLTDAMPSLAYFPYFFGERKVKEVWLNGKPLNW
jgi:imidazolonepropionase